MIEGNLSQKYKVGLTPDSHLMQNNSQQDQKPHMIFVIDEKKKLNQIQHPPQDKSNQQTRGKNYP